MANNAAQFNRAISDTAKTIIVTVHLGRIIEQAEWDNKQTERAAVKNQAYLDQLESIMEASPKFFSSLAEKIKLPERAPKLTKLTTAIRNSIADCGVVAEDYADLDKNAWGETFTSDAAYNNRVKLVKNMVAVAKKNHKIIEAYTGYAPEEAEQPAARKSKKAKAVEAAQPAKKAKKVRRIVQEEAPVKKSVKSAAKARKQQQAAPQAKSKKLRRAA